MVIYSLACRQNHQSGIANNTRGMENSKAFFKNDRVHNSRKVSFGGLFLFQNLL